MDTVELYSETATGTDFPDFYGDCRIGRLIDFNKKLDTQMDVLKLNEGVIESNLEELESILSEYDIIERYSLCRLVELTLFCVGNYANNNCMTEVGDFMVNPRLILVHIKGEIVPVVKERHTPFSVQFRDRAAENESVPEWLKCNTIVETVKEPLLPYLSKLLKKIGCDHEYIGTVKKQMNKMVELLSYLSMTGGPNKIRMEDWESSLENDDRMMMEHLFYKFDPAVFNDLGERIRHMSAFCCPL